MTETVTTSEAKAQFSRLLALVENDGDVVITRRGRPVARMIGAGTSHRRTLGMAAGTMVFRESFFDPLTGDELAAWYGEASAT